MKMHARIFRGSLIAAAVLLAVAAVPAWALEETVLEVNVPFAFMVNSTAFPAGPTVIKRISETDNTTWAVESKDGDHAATLLTDEINGENPPNRDEVVFNELGGKNFLAQLWFEGESIGREAVPSKLEKSMMKGTDEPTHHHVAAQRQKVM